MPLFICVNKLINCLAASQQKQGQLRQRQRRRERTKTNKQNICFNLQVGGEGKWRPFWYIVPSFVGPFSFPFTNCIRLKRDKARGAFTWHDFDLFALTKRPSKVAKTPRLSVPAVGYIFHAMHIFMKPGNWEQRTGGHVEHG